MIHLQKPPIQKGVRAARKHRNQQTKSTSLQKIKKVNPKGKQVSSKFSLDIENIQHHMLLNKDFLFSQIYNTPNSLMVSPQITIVIT